MTGSVWKARLAELGWILPIPLHGPSEKGETSSRIKNGLVIWEARAENKLTNVLQVLIWLINPIGLKYHESF